VKDKRLRALEADNYNEEAVVEVSHEDNYSSEESVRPSLHYIISYHITALYHVTAIMSYHCNHIISLQSYHVTAIISLHAVV
jgi:hypothetical protein